MFPNLKIALILSFLLISSCSQVESISGQDQTSNEEPIVAETSMTATNYGYLHFTDNCVMLGPRAGEEVDSTQLVILGENIVVNLIEGSLVYEGKKYMEGDYILLGGGYVQDSAAFKKEHNLNECGGLEVFIPN